MVGKKKTGELRNLPTTDTKVNRRRSQAKTSSASQPDTARTNTNTGDGARTTQRKQREVFILEDFILKNLQGGKISGTAKVKISLFPGCSMQDMRDHIKSISRKNPDEIVIHVGTNSLRPSETSLRDCGEEISNLTHMINEESSAELTTSDLVSRSDNENQALKYLA